MYQAVGQRRGGIVNLLADLREWLKLQGLLDEKEDKIEAILTNLEGTLASAAAADPATLWSTLCPYFAAEGWRDRQYDIYAWLNVQNQKLGGKRLPAWQPSDGDLDGANLSRVMQQNGFRDYSAFYDFSIQRREDFWELVRRELGIRMQTLPSRVFAAETGIEGNRWWPGAKLNIAESCFLARPDQVALIWQKEGTRELHQWSYRDLDLASARVSSALAHLGFAKGDRIAIVMPMTANAVAIYLGIIRLGAVVVSIADSFAPQEIQTRLRISQAKAIFTQDFIWRGGKKIPLLERVLAAQSPQMIVIPTNPEQMDRPVLGESNQWWDEFLALGTAEGNFAACDPEDEINILFSSGTTGEPKAIPWSHLTPIKCAMDGLFHHDIHDGERIAWPTNLGWMMGPWLIFAALINKATIAIFDGPPTHREFGQFVERAGVNILGLVPSLVKGWRRSQCMQGLNWSAIRLFSSTGEASSPDDYLYLMSLANNRPIIEYCGGTEIGGGYITGTVLHPAIPSTFTTPALGLEVLLLDEYARIAAQGEVFLVGPSVGLSNRLLNRDHHETYYANTPAVQGKLLRRHGDELVQQGDYWQALGRIDDTMNLGGIKVSSAEIERCLNRHPLINETAAIAVSPPNGGPSQLVIFAVLKDLANPPPNEDLRHALQKLINQDLNPLFKIQRLVSLEQLPRTASNKVMRRVLRQGLSDAV